MSQTGKIILGVMLGVVLIGAIGVHYVYKHYDRYATSSQSAAIGGYGRAEEYEGQGAMDAVSGPAAANYSLRAPGMPAPITPPAPVDAVKRLVIKTGSMSVVVKDVRIGIQKIAEYAEKNGGFVVSSNISQRGNAPYGTIMIRIPSDKFDAGVSEVKTFGEVTSEDTRGEDVTAEFVDLDSQIRNLKATEEQFLAIMKQATKIEDILNVQNQLSNIRGQIQVIQGRMNYLQKSADLSSLTITLSTDPSVLPIVEKQGNQWKPWVEVKEAARELIEVGKGIVSLFIWVLVFTPVWDLQ